MIFHRICRPCRIYRFGAGRSTALAGLLAAAMLTVSALNIAQADSPIAMPGVTRPDKLTPIMPVDQVRIGAKGYGLTVFHGDKIEPFAVEVISVMRDFNPQKNVIWIRCPDERMQKTGPVAGMSGSPIYLWDDHEPKEPGKGGRLIGAFAFGFGLTKDCYVGVQAIEQMRETASHAPADPANQRPATANAAPDPNLPQLSSMMQHLVDGHPAAKVATWQSKQMLRAVTPPPPLSPPSPPFLHSPPVPPVPPIPGSPTLAYLPMAVGSESVARFMAPLLSPYGIRPLAMPVAGGGSMAANMPTGKPPKEIDAQKISLAPGSVLSIPLVGGDLDLSAVGTVTEVLPDGRILAFGHAMFAQGDVELPMASGFVHYIVPNLVSSFKLAGSGVVRGAVVRDENSGIVGLPNGKYQTAPLTIRLQQPDMPQRTYRYEIARHRKLQPMLTAIAAILSTKADVESPEESTCLVQGELTFSNGQTIRLSSMVPLGADRALLMNLLPPLMMLANNDFEPVYLDRADLSLTVEPGMKLAEIVDGRLDTYLARPGQSVSLLARFRPYRQPEFEKRFEFRLPNDLPDGDYPLMICDSATYGQLLLQTKPKLTDPRSVADMQAMIQQVLSVPNDAVFLVLQKPEMNLAIDRQEMPKLPSSRRAVLAPEGKSDVVPYGSILTQIHRQPMVISGQAIFTVSVRRHGDDIAPTSGGGVRPLPVNPNNGNRSNPSPSPQPPVSPPS